MFILTFAILQCCWGYEQGTEQKYIIHMFDAGNEKFLKSQLKTVVRCSIIPEPELVVVS